MEMKCKECERTSDEGRLRKCPICFQYFCEEHLYHWSGRAFCSRGCAEHFFFGETDD